MVPWSRRVSYASECSFIFLSVCSGQIIMYLLSIPTIGSWWSQWVVMAVHHCYLWARWWSDTLGVTLHKVMNSVGQLSQTGTDPQRLSGWFLGFITAGFNKSANHLWYITTVLFKILEKKSTHKPTVLCWFLHENHQIIEVFETAATSGSAILIFFLPKTITVLSLILKYYKKKNQRLLTKSNISPTRVMTALIYCVTLKLLWIFCCNFHRFKVFLASLLCLCLS